MKDSLRNLIVTLGRFSRMNLMDIVLLGPDNQKIKMTWYDCGDPPYIMDLLYSKKVSEESSIEGSEILTEEEIKTGKWDPIAFYVSPETESIKIDFETKCWTIEPGDLEKIKKRAKRKYAYYKRIQGYLD